MATLISWRRVSDGVDIDCEIGSARHTFHQQSGLISSDMEAQIFIDECAAQILAAQVTESYTVICEDGEIINA